MEKSINPSVQELVSEKTQALGICKLLLRHIFQGLEEQGLEDPGQR